MEIQVYYHDFQLSSPQRMGTLSSQHKAGKDIFSFSFDSEWLHNPRCRLLDPELQLFRGAQYVSPDKSTFGAFADSAPDRWGRVLMDRREAVSAREQQRPVRPLSEADYLLGVYDDSRLGALRFKLSENDPFVAYDPQMAAPPFAAVRDLEYASWQYENDIHLQDSKWLHLLLAPGSSLGGARPKANVQDSKGHLWIAKFPSRNDKEDVAAWEQVAMLLAQRCGISVPTTQIQKYTNNYHTFLSRRFDRDDMNRRIHFASAMNMLGYTDGAHATTGVSYLQLAEWISMNVVNVQENLLQLWRRIVFNIAIGNSDDHLRNHGFLFTSKGWTLSPAYDLNPDEYSSSLSLNINESDNSMDYDLAIEVAPFFGLTADIAQSILKETKLVVSDWQRVATSLHISRQEQLRKAPAFHI